MRGARAELLESWIDQNCRSRSLFSFWVERCPFQFFLVIESAFSFLFDFTCLYYDVIRIFSAIGEMNIKVRKVSLPNFKRKLSFWAFSEIWARVRFTVFITLLHSSLKIPKEDQKLSFSSKFGNETFPYCDIHFANGWKKTWHRYLKKSTATKNACLQTEKSLVALHD